jgi:raffinose/stachyose/melibiose transport system substrate-binding protein
MVLLIATVGLALVFTGCKKKEAAGSAQAGAVSLTVLNYYDMTAASAADELDVVWAAYDKISGGVKIVREDLFNEPFHNKVEAYAAAGQMPDVVYAWPSGRSTTLHTQRLLKDLGPLVARDNLAAYMVPTALDPSQQASNFIGELPRAITSSHAFYVNNEVLRAAGLTPAKTYDELKAQVPILRAKGYDTVLMANQDTWVMQSCFFSMIAGRFGGEGWDQKILSGQTKFTDPGFVNALAFIKALYDDGVISKATLTTDYGSVVGQFATNKGAYLIDGDWRIAAFVTDKTTGDAAISAERQKNIDITVFPDIASAVLNKSTSGILGTGWGINAAIPAGSAKEEAAWNLVKWLSGKEIQTWLLENGGISTPTVTTIDTSALTLEPMQVAGVNLAKQYTSTTAVIDGVFAGEVYTPLNDGLQELGMGSKTPQQVAAAVQAAFDAWNK